LPSGHIGGATTSFMTRSITISFCGTGAGAAMTNERQTGVARHDSDADDDSMRAEPRRFDSIRASVDSAAIGRGGGGSTHGASHAHAQIGMVSTTKVYTAQTRVRITHVQQRERHRACPILDADDDASSQWYHCAHTRRHRTYTHSLLLGRIARSYHVPGAIALRCARSGCLLVLRWETETSHAGITTLASEARRTQAKHARHKQSRRSCSRNMMNRYGLMCTIKCSSICERSTIHSGEGCTKASRTKARDQV
jgi:hypothetical protein